MGDSGALLLGYMLNVFVFSFCEMNAKGHVPENFRMTAAPAVAFTILIVPLFDTLRVMVTRIKKGYSPFTADKNHVHHLLLSLGLKHREVTFILIGISIAFIILAVLIRNLSNGFVAVIVLTICVLLTKLLWALVEKKSQR